MTVDEAVAIALQHGFTVRLAQSQVARQRAVVNETRGNLGPRATVGANYTRFDQAGTSSFGGQTFQTSPIDSKTVTAQVAMPLFSPALSATARAAQDQLRATEQTFSASANDIKLAARQAFFQVLRAQRQVIVQQQALADAQDQLKNTQLLEKGGVAARVDVLRSQAQVQQSQADLITAQNNLDIANANFNATLARPIDAPVQLVDIDQLPPKPADEGQLRSAAQAQRPEAKAILFRRKSLENVRKAQAAGLLPSLNATLNYSRNLDPFRGQRATNASGTLLLSWPIFDSGVTHARVEEVRQDEIQAGIQYDQLLESISQEVRQAMANLENSSQRLSVAEQQVTVADENLRLARLRYQAGEGILLQVTDAETQLTQARTSLVAAKYDYLNAYSQLQRALGADNVTAPAAPGKEQTK